MIKDTWEEAKLGAKKEGTVDLKWAVFVFFASIAIKITMPLIVWAMERNKKGGNDEENEG